MDEHRRLVLKGLIGVTVAAPMVVKAESLMKLWLPGEDYVVTIRPTVDGILDKSLPHDDTVWKESKLWGNISIGPPKEAVAIFSTSPKYASGSHYILRPPVITGLNYNFPFYKNATKIVALGPYD